MSNFIHPVIRDYCKIFNVTGLASIKRVKENLALSLSDHKKISKVYWYGLEGTLEKHGFTLDPQGHGVTCIYVCSFGWDHNRFTKKLKVIILDLLHGDVDKQLEDFL